MKNKSMFLILGVVTMLGAASCARNEAPAAEQQQPAVPQPDPAPVRDSAWKPAPLRSASNRPASTPAKAPTPAPVAPGRYETPTAPAPAAPSLNTRRVAQPMRVTLPENATLAVRVGETLNSEKNEIGDSWSGVLAEPVTIDGLIVANRGSSVEGRVTNVLRAGRVKGVAQLTVALSRFVTADGQSVNVNTSSFTAVGKDETKKDAAKVGIASGIGAAIGAIAGKGKGAAIGAGAGAAAGTGVVLATRGGPAIIGNEALINFRVSEPVTITEKLK